MKAHTEIRWIAAGLRCRVSGMGMEARLASVLARSAAITVVGAMRYEAGYANDLWFFDSDTGPLVAKLRRVPEEDPEQLRTYAGTMARLRDAGYPTPELLLLEEECEALGGRQLSVLRYVPGAVAADVLDGRNRTELTADGPVPASSTQSGSISTTPLAAPSRRRLFRDLGRAVGRLHAIDLPAATGWRDDAGVVRDSWPAVVRASLAEARTELTSLAGEERRLIDLAGERIERDAAILLPTVTVPRLVHRDLHPGNILVEDDAVTAVIDFEMVREWDAAYDFVKIDNSIFTPFPDARDPFLAGYHEHVPPERDFAARVRLYQGLYCVLTAADFLAGNDGHRDWSIRLRTWLNS